MLRASDLLDGAAWTRTLVLEDTSGYHKQNTIRNQKRASGRDGTCIVVSPTLLVETKQVGRQGKVGTYLDGKKNLG